MLLKEIYVVLQPFRFLGVFSTILVPIAARTSNFHPASLLQLFERSNHYGQKKLGLGLGRKQPRLVILATKTRSNKPIFNTEIEKASQKLQNAAR